MPWAEALIRANAKQEKLPESGRSLSYTDALNEALDLALAMDANVLLMGQGIDDPMASFGVTKNLAGKFGAERVFDTPLSEEGMTGIAIGAATTGSRPVLFHNRPDFLLLSFNQIVTHASKWHYIDNGQTRVPLVIWSAIGRGWGSGAQHSQAIQGMLLGVPGLKIAMPSTPYDAKGILLSAIADNGPVLIFEHRWLMRSQGVVPEGFYVIPLGKGVYRRRGSQLTIVGCSHAIELAQRALDETLQGRISADVIDLRTVKPLDTDLILESVRKTGRLLVVDTGWEIGGLCAEIGFLVAEKAFESLKGPVRRVALPDVPTPAGFTLEQYFYPNEAKIAAAIEQVAASDARPNPNATIDTAPRATGSSGRRS
jgi:pyruvate dehydrogenase E1 component beta subunit